MVPVDDQVSPTMLQSPRALQCCSGRSSSMRCWHDRQFRALPVRFGFGARDPVDPGRRFVNQSERDTESPAPRSRTRPTQPRAVAQRVPRLLPARLATRAHANVASVAELDETPEFLLGRRGRGVGDALKTRSLPPKYHVARAVTRRTFVRVAAWVRTHGARLRAVAEIHGIHFVMFVSPSATPTTR
jgi:hypothetical protein